jgi:hypothetical protein
MYDIVKKKITLPVVIAEEGSVKAKSITGNEAIHLILNCNIAVGMEAYV